MVNFKKKLRLMLIWTIIAAFFGANFAFAQETNKAEESTVLKLSLADALKMAEENNPQVALSKLAVEKAQLAKEEIYYRDKKAKEQEKESKQSPGPSVSNPLAGMLKVSPSDFEYKYNMELGKMNADFALRMAQAGVEATLRNIRFGVEAAYYRALAARDNLKISRDALERQQDMLKIAEAKYRAGTIAKMDLMDAQVQVAKAQTAVATAEAEKQKAYINLKKLLNIDMKKEIELTDTFEYKPLDSPVDLEKMLKDALEKRLEIIEAQGKLDIAQLDFDMTGQVYPSNTFKYKEKEYALNEARMNLENARKDIEAEVRGIVLDLQEAEANIPVLDKSLEMAQESLRLAKLNFEAGVMRRVDVSQAEEMLEQVEFQRSQAIYNYNLAKVRLENVVYIPVSAGSFAGQSGSSAGGAASVSGGAGTAGSNAPSSAASSARSSI